MLFNATPFPFVAVLVAFENQTYTGFEGSTLEVCAVLIGTTERRFTVTMFTESNGLAQGEFSHVIYKAKPHLIIMSSSENVDFEEISVDLEFVPSGLSQRCQNVAILSDSVFDLEEQFIVALNSSDSGVRTGVSATVTIRNVVGI